MGALSDLQTCKQAIEKIDNLGIGQLLNFIEDFGGENVLIQLVDEDAVAIALIGILPGNGSVGERTLRYAALLTDNSHTSTNSVSSLLLGLREWHKQKGLEHGTRT